MSIFISTIAGALAVAIASSLRAQNAPVKTYTKDIPDSLATRATITETAAAATAQRRVPKGVIQAVELEVEKGKLMYSYDIKTTGKRGTDEVNVDATSGTVIGFSHESAATEKKEAAAEAAATKAAKAKKP
jgi:uncharacterized membrane protein YkoI